MLEDDKLNECLKAICERRWTWFISLRYPTESRLVPKDARELTPFELVKCWLEVIDWEFNRTFPCESVCINERRENGEVQFHILLNRVPPESRSFWRSQWRFVSGGGTWERPLSSNMQGLFRYLVERASLVECRTLGRYILSGSDDEKWARRLRQLWKLRAKKNRNSRGK
jgi:hypothetical protein